MWIILLVSNSLLNPWLENFMPRFLTLLVWLQSIVRCIDTQLKKILSPLNWHNIGVLYELSISLISFFSNRNWDVIIYILSHKIKQVYIVYILHIRCSKDNFKFSQLVHIMKKNVTINKENLYMYIDVSHSKISIIKFTQLALLWQMKNTCK